MTNEFAQSVEPVCDMCDHPLHGNSDCGVEAGYDHINGSHECGCPGSLQAQMQDARAEGWETAHDAYCVVAGQMLCTLHENPYLRTPPGQPHETHRTSHESAEQHAAVPEGQHDAEDARGAQG